LKALLAEPYLDPFDQVAVAGPTRPSPYPPGWCERGDAVLGTYGHGHWGYW
jgi:hypothetical protein